MEPVFLDNYHWRRLLYLATKSLLSRQYKFRGYWRVPRFIKGLVHNRYVKAPYLNGDTIWVCPNHPMDKVVFSGAVYEPQTIKIIQDFMRAAFSFVDVGANIGLHTVAAGRCLCAAHQQLVAFEPEPFLFKVLRANCELNRLQSVRLLPTAVGQEDGTAQLYVSNNLHKGLNSFFLWDRVSESLTCQVVTLDTMFLQVSVLRGSVLLKIDVEGAEPLVVEGGLQWLGELQDLAIICEIEPDNLRRAGYSPSQLLQLLSEVGCENRFLIGEADRNLYPIGSLESTNNELSNPTHIKGNMIASKGRKAIQILEGFNPVTMLQ